MKLTRRQFAKLSAMAGGAMMVPWRFKLARAAIEGGSLPPSAVPKFVTPLVKPPAVSKVRGSRNMDKYDIAMRQFVQQILPAEDAGGNATDLPATTVWSYGQGRARNTNLDSEYFYPAFTIENTWNRVTQVLWRNQLLDNKGNPLPHLLPVDPSLHWANPIGRRDTRPNPTMDPNYWSHPYIDQDGRYTGPVPMVTHVHGAHTTEDSDGYAEAWWLPEGVNGNVNWPTGTFFDYFSTKYAHYWDPGAAAFKYPNDQPATTLWYHDHTLGMTRLNVYAGPAGFWLIRGGPADLDLGYVAPGAGDSPLGEYTEIPIVIQDRSFDDTGSLFYPDNRAFFEGILDRSKLQIPFTYDQLEINPDANGWGLGCDPPGGVSDVAPIWNPEFFGNMMVVNGQTWPYLEVEQRRYRFRFLNGCNSRFLILKTDNGMPFYQIGSDQGFLSENAVQLNSLLMGPAERADVIMDFTNIPVGNEVILLNFGPDEPFGGGEPPDAFDQADPESTGLVMQFRVKAATSPDTTTPPLDLELPKVDPLVVDKYVDVSLNEESSKNIKVSEDSDGNIVYDCDGEVFGPTAALLGTLNSGNGDPKLWMEAVSENPALNTTEEWTIYNFTADAHPIHVHLVHFQVVSREQLEVDEEGVANQPAVFVPDSERVPEAWETGFKDTVIAYPGEVTRIRMKFDLPGFYVWHCHIVEHEDNEMMRPYVVGPQDPNAQHPHQ